MDALPARTIIADRYELVQGPQENRRLAGGMGLVYLCRDQWVDKPVVLKTFQPQYLRNRVARARFLREGSVWISLGYHPHIVRCYNVECIGDGREVYLVLQWIAQAEGKPDASLRSSLLPGKLLSAEQALRIALHVVWGMQHATRQVAGLVHRDLKPENVLLGRNGNALVSDFGLVTGRLEDGGPVERLSVGDMVLPKQATAVVGTPLYMAPEQWDENTTLDQRTDIYALGCMLYELLTGQSTVSGASQEELAAAHTGGRAQTVVDALPHEWKNLLRRCVEAERERRYENWHEVEAALQTAYVMEVGARLFPPTHIHTESRAERVLAGSACNALGKAYFDIGYTAGAQRHFEQVIAVGKAELFRELEGDGLYNLGTVYRALGEVQRAVGYYEHGLAIAQEVGNRAGEGTVLSALGEAYHALGKGRTAIVYCEQALAIAREVGNRGGEAKALGDLGGIYKDLGELEQAIKYHEKHLTIAREIGSRCRESDALGNLGNAYHALGEARKAIEHYEHQLMIAHELGDRYAEGRVLGNLGTAFSSIGEMRRAIEYYEQRLAIAHELGDRYAEGRVLGNLGSVYNELGDRQRSIGYSEKALAIAQELEDVYGTAVTSFNLALMFFEPGGHAVALRYAQTAMRLFTQIEHRQMMQQARRLVADLQGKL